MVQFETSVKTRSHRIPQTIPQPPSVMLPTAIPFAEFKRRAARCDSTQLCLIIRLRELISIALATGCLLVSAAHNVHATEFSVPGDFATIQAALDSSQPGDVVRVSPGTYRENLDFKQKNIDLIGTSGAEVTIIDAALSTGVKIGPGGSITGFTIRNARATFGAGMEVRGINSYIAFNIFEDNAQDSGGFGAAIGMNASSPIIDSNIFRRNTADTQFFSGVIGLINDSSPFIANNIFYDNPCRAINATVPATAAPVVVNNTMVRNNSVIRVDRRVNTANQIFRNNIIVANGIGLEVDFGTEANNPVWENNLVWGNGTDYKTISNQTGINGNISEDPLFVDPANNNFRLKLESPAIDAGTNMSAPAQDFEREIRPVDGDGDNVALVDIGADELAFGINLVVDGGDVLECARPQGTTVFVHGAAFPSGVQIASAELFLNGQSVAMTLPAQVTLPFGNSSLEVSATTTDGRGIRGRRSVKVVDTLPPVINAQFVDRRSGKTLSCMDARGMEFVVVKINVKDACDANPSVQSVIGSEIGDGDRLRFLGNSNQVILSTEEISLKVSATDFSGNMAEFTQRLSLRGNGHADDSKEARRMPDFGREKKDRDQSY